MSEDNVTSINRPQSDLDRLTGYSGSIQGTPLDEALDEQRVVLIGAQGILKHALELIGDCSAYGSIAIRGALKSIEAVTAALDAGTLEDRALAIARARQAGSAAVPS